MQKNATKVQNGLAATVRGSFLQLKPRFRTFFALFLHFFRTFFTLFSHFFRIFLRENTIFPKSQLCLENCEKSVKKCEKVQKSAKKVRKLGFSCKKSPNRGGEAILHFFCTFFTFFRIFPTLFFRKASSAWKNAKKVQKKCEKSAKPRFQLHGGEAILHFFCTLFTLYLHFICTSVSSPTPSTYTLFALYLHFFAFYLHFHHTFYPRRPAGLHFICTLFGLYLHFICISFANK